MNKCIINHNNVNIHKNQVLKQLILKLKTRNNPRYTLNFNQIEKFFQLFKIKRKIIARNEWIVDNAKFNSFYYRTNMNTT